MKGTPREICLIFWILILSGTALMLMVILAEEVAG